MSSPDLAEAAAGVITDGSRTAGSPTLFLRLRDHTEPTDPQKEAGNYAKRRVSWMGMEISVENEAGSIRRGVSRLGEHWAVRMFYAYGYLRRTTGVDGDQVDVYLGPLLDSAPTVYVVHQRCYGDWDAYDEDKVMIGFADEESAREAYLSCYDDHRFLGPITAMPVEEFVAKAKATLGAPAMIKTLLIYRP